MHVNKVGPPARPFHKSTSWLTRHPAPPVCKLPKLLLLWTTMLERNYRQRISLFIVSSFGIATFLAYLDIFEWEQLYALESHSSGKNLSTATSGVSNHSAELQVESAPLYDDRDPKVAWIMSFGGSVSFLLFFWTCYVGTFVSTKMMWALFSITCCLSAGNFVHHHQHGTCEWKDNRFQLCWEFFKACSGWVERPVLASSWVAHPSFYLDQNSLWRILYSMPCKGLCSLSWVVRSGLSNLQDFSENEWIIVVTFDSGGARTNIRWNHRGSGRPPVP